MAKRTIASTRLIQLLLLAATNAILAVAAITTKSLQPTIITGTNNNNNTDTSQLVQIRSLLQQPTRAFLIQHKTALSPIQQTQILDDVQKNQKVLSPSVIRNEDKQRSLFGGGIHQIPFPYETANIYSPIKPIIENSHIVSGNLSPPPVSGIILSSQPPIQQQPQFNYISAFRPSTNVDHLYRQSPIIYESFKPERQVQQDFRPSSTPPSIDSVRKLEFIPSSITTVPTVILQQQHQQSNSDKPSLNQLFNAYKHTTTPSSYYVLSESQTQPPHKSISSNYFNKLQQSDSSFINHVTSKPHNKDLSTSKNYATSNKLPSSGEISTNNNDNDNNKIIKEIYLKTNPEILIANDRQKFFQQLLEDGKNSDFLDGSKNSNDQTTAQSDSNSIKTQFEKELLRQLQAESNSVPKLNIPSSALSLLPANFTGISEISLPNGQKIQVSKDYNQLAADNTPGSATDIRTIILKQTTTTNKPPERLLAELTKGVLPPGADFELIRHNQDGGLEEVGNLPQNLPQKKVTFVILEEQPDGSVKVQGVRGSEKESLKESGEEVDSIIRKIKEGQLKLPPSINKINTNNNGSNKKIYQDLVGSVQNKQIVDGKSSTQKSSDFQPSLDFRIKNINKKKTTANNDVTNEILKAFKQEQTSIPNKPAFLPTPSVVNNNQPTQTSSQTKPNYNSVSSSLHPTVTYPFLSSAPTGNFYVQDDRLLSGNYVGQNTAPSVAENSVRDDFPTSYPMPQQAENNDQNIFTWNIGDVNYHRDHSTPSPSFLSTTTQKVNNNNEENAIYFYNNSGYFSSLLPNDVPDPTTSNQLTTLTDLNLPQEVFYQTTTVHETSASTIPPLQYTSIVRTQTPDEISTQPIITTATPALNVDNNNNYYNRIPTRKQHKNQSEKGILPYQQQQTEYAENEDHTSKINEFDKQQTNSTLSDLLKKEGFYAMAKFLKQSGLDSILNDTGPFTLFVPTDKAFRTLLIQLGGPDKAEEKFKDNPRLLSGLLLHHVIPGAFRVGSLQDEMTGVSLAGTQLRVNTYTTHDIEWNDVKIVTVNGARILDEKDIVIPQGIAHAIDRVMFPLPVGNLLQSLQADRENRYSNFIHILEQSGLQPLLTGTRTFTVFAPLNRAFSTSDYSKLSTSPKDAKSFILKHVVPGALYSAGMKYYQVRESMDDSQQITIYKEAGRIKVNAAHVVTRNIPATNGVIHAIDTTL